MILITSASYIEREYQIDLGNLPPSFLPVGNKRLYEHQIDQLKKTFPNEKVFLSLPKCFDIPPYDAKKLEEYEIKILPLENSLSLGRSIYNALNQISSTYVRILHGDTLIKDIHDTLDHITISKTFSEYDWEYSLSQKDQYVLSGYFAFSSKEKFQNILNNTKYDFIKSIKQYDELLGVKRLQSKEWFDFGHLNCYFTNRSKITSEREFNKLEIRDGYLTKSSSNQSKIKGEIFWFDNLPKNLSQYTPKTYKNLASNHKDSYSIEYLPSIALNELLVFSKKPEKFWIFIFKKISSMLNDFSKTKVEIITKEESYKYCEQLYLNKTNERLTNFLESTNLSLKTKIILNRGEATTLTDIIKVCYEKLEKEISLNLVHGDLCFSNILYESRMNSLKVIDPRGVDPFGNPSIYGDLRYEHAKLYHCVFGGYDFITAGRYDLSVNFENSGLKLSFNIQDNESLAEVQSAFYESFLSEKSDINEINHIVVLLFLSMLPLHNDNEKKQYAILANAIRLFKDLI